MIKYKLLLKAIASAICCFFECIDHKAYVLRDSNLYAPHMI